jgi:CheY-like chemotaxis protein
VDSVPVLPPEIADAKLTVLIVEDEFLLRWAAADFLRERGYLVIEATSVPDAISIFESGAHVDLVFSDVHMPGTLSGHDLAEWLEQHRPKMPVLLTSGSPSEGHKLPPGAQRRFITKPYELGDIEAVIGSMRQS